MLPLLNQAKNEELIAVQLIVHQIRERPAFSAAKTVSAKVIASAADDDRPDRLLHSRMKILTQLGAIAA
jgi:hypothetical protein